jgi:predicted permease
VVRTFYRLLLFACPRAVRREYGAEMEDVFLHCLRTEWSRRGWFGRAFVVGRGIGDTLVFAVRARREAGEPVGAVDAAQMAPRKRRPFVTRQDIRSTWRFMRKQPFFAGAIVLMLALGLGATTTIFSVVYGVLLKPLPFPEPDRLVSVSGEIPARGTMSLTEANFWDMRDRLRTFEEFGAWHSASFTLTGFENPERVTGATVSVGFFRALAAPPAAGRLFEPGEDAMGAPRDKVLLSNAFWTRRFGTDTSIVGRPISLDGRPYVVIGILPAGTPWLNSADVFVPFIQRADANRTSWEYAGIGRLKAGVSFEAGLDDLRRVARELETEFSANKDLSATMQPSRTWIASDGLRRTLWILLGAVGLLLLIACVNVMNLLLARAAGRIRDSAVRTALGATRADLIRERVTESLVLTAVGAAVGWLVAIGMLQVLKTLDPGGIPRLTEVTLNGWAALVATGSAFFVGVITGLIPALRAPFVDIIPALGPGQRRAIGDRSQDRLRGILVGAEVALSLVLLVGAGLLVRSLAQVLAVDRGFATEQRLLLTVSVPSSYPEGRRAQTVRDLLSRLQAMPELVSVAAVSGRPLSGGSTGMGIGAADKPDAGAAVPWATWRVVTRDYYKTMGLPLLMGRNFDEQEVPGKPWRVIISKRTADLLWPGENPIGRTAILWKGQNSSNGEVIGVVGNMRERGLEADPTLAVYLPAGPNMASSTLQLVMHTKGEPLSVAAPVRAVVASVDPTLPVSNIRTLEDIVSRSVATRRFTMLLLVTFAALALVLAVAGVYGVLSYSVARRTSEIGVRLTLGAQPGRLLRMVLLRGMRPVLIGMAIGLAAMYWLSQLMATMLFEVQPNDLPTFLIVGAALLVTGIAACYVPARQVLRVDPVEALRIE